MAALEPICGELVESTLSKIREKRKIAARGVYPAPSFALAPGSRYTQPDAAAARGRGGALVIHGE